MPKYLMFDHGGVLETYSNTYPEGNDLLLGEVQMDDGSVVYQVLKNGYLIIDYLNELASYGYQFVSHSNNQEGEQLEFLDRLYAAARAEGKHFPAITAMAIFNPAKCGETGNKKLVMVDDNRHKIRTIYYYDNGSSGKSFIRQAFAEVLKITSSQDMIIFDDGTSVVEKAREENCEAYLINTPENAGAVSLKDALAEVLHKARAGHAVTSTHAAAAAAPAAAAGIDDDDNDLLISTTTETGNESLTAATASTRYGVFAEPEVRVGNTWAVTEAGNILTEKQLTTQHAKKDLIIKANQLLATIIEQKELTAEEFDALFERLKNAIDAGSFEVLDNISAEYLSARPAELSR